MRPSNLVFSLAIAAVLSPYLILSGKISPLNEEEWIIGEKSFVTGFDSEREEFVLASSFCSDHESYEIRKRLTDSVWLSFSKLPPIVQLCIFGRSVPLLGWGHVGPVSLLYYKVFEGILGQKVRTAEPALLRIPAILALILMGFVFAQKTKSRVGFLFFISFPVNLFFISVANLYYSLLYVFSVLAFFCILERRFICFYLWSCLSVLTHLRGLVIFLSFLFAFVIMVLLERGREESKRRDLEMFFRTLPLSSLVLLSLSLYFIPSLAEFPSREKTYAVGVFSSFEIFRYFVLKILGKLPLLLQLVGTRIGDVVISLNLPLLLRELGVLREMPLYLLIVSVIVSVPFFVPVFVAGDVVSILSFALYFLASVFAVPFFFGMPWQFIPVNFLLLIPSCVFYKDRNLIALPVIFGSVFNWYAVFKSTEFLSPYALWRNHAEVKEVILREISERPDAGPVLAITKSNIFHLFSDQHELKYFVQISEERRNRKYMSYLAVAARRYRVIVVSYHFWHVVRIFEETHRQIFENEVFKVLVLDEMVPEGSGE